MDKKYVLLFKDIAKATAMSAESVMDYNRKQSDEKGLETATIMRDDFKKLANTIESAGDNYVPTQPDAARLLVGAYVIANQLNDKIKALQKAMSGYMDDVIPKLQKIVDNAGKDEELAAKMANELFIIENKE
jgi:hypothetical protein